MDIEFHYYVNFVVAASAGLSKNKSYLIAYSSQFVDDNFKELQIYHDDKIFTSPPTQMYDITNPDSEEIWQMFHFIPGFITKSNRKDRKIDNRIVVKDGVIANKAMEYSLQRANYYLIGIASHAYADTWAHQNFIGSFSNLNRSQPCNSYIINNFGHADVFDMPDTINLVWQDYRLRKSAISNKKRALEAASKLFDYYKSFARQTGKTNKIVGKQKLLKMIADAIGEETHTILDFWQRNKRIQNYNKICNTLFGHDIPEYSTNTWIDSAFKKRYGKYIGKIGFKKSDFYQFCKAANIYRKFMINQLNII